MCVAEDPASSSKDERTAWRYVGTTKDKPTLEFRHRKTNEWFVDRPDGTRVEYRELSRTADEIIVQNLKTRLIVRLTAGRGYWRLPKDDADNWRTWVIGEWVKPRPGKPEPAPGNTPAPDKQKQRQVRLVYFVPSDRRPIENYRRRIGVVMEIVSEIFRDDLQRKRYRSEGFELERDSDDVVVHLVEADKPARNYNDAPRYDRNEQWRQVVPVVREQLGPKEQQVVVIFTETYDNGPAEYGWPGGIALGAYYTADGGTAVFSAHLLREEFCGLTLDEQRRKFFDPTPVPGRRCWGQKMNSPRGKFAEDGIGAVAHELGHAFGLPHDRRRDDQFIMGNGFRNLRRNFSPSNPRRVGFSDENAALLMSSRYLNTELDAADSEPPHVDLKLVVERPRSLFAKIKVSDNKQLRTAIFSDGVAGTIVAGETLTGTSKTLRKRIPQAKVQNGSVEIRVIVTDEGGNQTRVTQSLKVQ
ncbi:MAG: hypothetical protein ACYTGL_31250 [Planctomycetota bacterium]